MKNNHTLQPGAQKPHPGPLPTGPCMKKKTATIITLHLAEIRLGCTLEK